MAVIVVTPPEPVVTLDEAKKHVRFTAVDDDAYLTSLVAAVTALLDGPRGRLGTAIGLQTLMDSRPCFPGPIRLYERADLWVAHCGPIVSLTALSYLDMADSNQAIDVSTLSFDDWGVEAPTSGWPNTPVRFGAARLTYQAGYAVVPANIKHAILLMVGTLYANREATPDDAYSPTVANLLSNYSRVV